MCKNLTISVVRSTNRFVIMDNVKETVLEIIAERLKVTPEEVDGKTFNQIDINSLDAVTIVFELEEAFGLSLPDEMIYKFQNVDELIKAVRQDIEDKAQ